MAADGVFLLGRRRQMAVDDVERGRGQMGGEELPLSLRTMRKQLKKGS